MKNGKRRSAYAKREPNTRGADWAEQAGNQCNSLADSQREMALERALPIAFGPDAEPVASGRG